MKDLALTVVGIGTLGILLIIVITLLSTFLTWLIWNLVVPVIFGLPHITFFQAFLLNILFNIFFKSTNISKK